MLSAKLVFNPQSFIGWGSLEHLIPEVKKFSSKKNPYRNGPCIKYTRISGSDLSTP